MLYADDTTLHYSADSPSQLFAVMNDALTTLSDWFRSNKLSLNASKTQYMIFDASAVPGNFQDNLKIAQIPIQRVESAKFLGIIVDEKLTWREHIRHCQRKIRSGIYALNMVKHSLSAINLRMLYFSLVHPFLQYGNILWGSACKTHIHCLTVLQKRALQIISHSNYNEHTSALFKSFLIPKLDDIFNIQLLTTMRRCVLGELPNALLKHFRLNDSLHNYNTRHCHDIQIGLFRKQTAFRSF